MKKRQKVKVCQLLFKLKSINSYQWKWHWLCVPINLYHNYNKHTKILRKRFKLDYWFTRWSYIIISKYKPVAGSSYDLPKKLDRPRNSLINIQNIDDNECFKCCFVRYLNPADHNPEKITKGDRDFAKKIGFKDIKFSVKIRDIHKIEQKQFHWY